MSTAIEFIHPIDRERLASSLPTTAECIRLNDLEIKLRSVRSLAEAFELVIDGLAPLIPFDRVGLALLEDDGTMVAARELFTVRPVQWGEHERRPLLGSSMEPLIREGAIRIIHDLQEYQRLRPSSLPTKRLIEEGMRSSLTVPLYHHEDPLGFLFFTSTRADAYTPAHVALISRVAATIGQTVGRLINPSRLPA